MMGHISILPVVYCCLVAATNARQLRGGEIETTDRNLEWVWAPTHRVVNDNVFYGHRTEKGYNDNRRNPGISDREDFLRSADLCFEGTDLSRDNCPSPPDCNWVSNEGPAKLCINRAPLPNNHDIYYVLMMKCVPKYVNCDKCMCGQISVETDKEAHCTFQDQNPSDDQSHIRCNDLRTVKVTSVETGETFSFSPHWERNQPKSDSSERSRTRRRKKNKLKRHKKDMDTKNS